MKKLLLLAMLLGLTGCGDNNQSDTQSNAQASTLQKAEVTPVVANYSLAASPRTLGAVAPLAGWNVTKSTVMGASTLIDAAKGSMTSAALITPNATQVAEVLRGGAAGIALSIAVDQLLDAVDWVMDPANNQIKYHERDPIKPPNLPFYYRSSFPLEGNYVYGATKVQLCNKMVAIANGINNGYSYELTGINGQNSGQCVVKMTRIRDGEKSNGAFSYTSIDNNSYDPKKLDRALSLETVAEKVISNADAGSLDAQVATNLAAQNILHDVVQAEPVVQELENNARNNCPSGIINKKGDCWVCSRESYTPIRGRVIYAKEIVGGLGKCDSSMNSSQLLTRRNAYAEFGSARDAENSCWSPPDGFHLSEASEAKRIANDCNTFLGVLGQ